MCQVEIYGLSFDEWAHPVEVSLPSSKSICNRALVVGALSGGGKIGNISDCDDTRAVIDALKGGDVVDIGAAGTAMRFLTAYFAQCTDCKVRLTGSDRMRKRPISVLVDALRGIGADIRYAGEQGYPPLDIRGRTLEGGCIKVDSTVSSQYISALLMIAPLCRNGLSMELEGNAASRPYIDMTLDVMRDFGVTAVKDGRKIIVAPQSYKPCDYEVEGDWSAASYWYEMISLSPLHTSVFLRTLRINSVQGDSVVAEIFKHFGVSTEYFPDGIRLTKTAAASGFFRYDFSDCPDLAQTVVATCCIMRTGFVISGIKSLRIKETDRISALIDECARMGCVLLSDGDESLSFSGEAEDVTGQLEFHTYDDHRMAMAFAPAAMRFRNVEIIDPAVVSKSYPAYWDDLTKAGFSIVKIRK